ncbi:MAG: hypothetical protein K0Q79_75 [Flavipsychrobacter sp.]|jgi:opacity protein-like surface antigen|nr:hypothetical protein [Flavipsychrobacter sp.]
MQRIFAILAFLLVPAMLLAQDVADKKDNGPKPVVKPSRDFLMVQMLYTGWNVKEDTSMTMPKAGFGYKFNAYLCYDFPIKKTKFSFAAGIGVSASVMHLKDQLIRNTDTGVVGNQLRFMADTANFKRYKFATTYIQAPFELRFFGNSNNRNKGFKAAIGVEVGAHIGSHTKGVTSVSGTIVKYKTNTKRYISPWNFAATARMGWGNFSIFGSYNLTNVLKDQAGPVITPYSFGLCITGL